MVIFIGLMASYVCVLGTIRYTPCIHILVCMYIDYVHRVLDRRTLPLDFAFVHFQLYLLVFVRRKKYVLRQHISVCTIGRRSWQESRLGFGRLHHDVCESLVGRIFQIF